MLNQKPIAHSKIMLELIAKIEQIARSDISVFFMGESGTGKEVMAKYLHTCSKRKNYPFVAINCATIPESLFEAELFGYEKGAFSGADKSRVGLFEQANKGTLFLDEITEMPSSLQSKLLRSIQEKEYRRLGSNNNVSLDIRIVVASNKNVEKEVKLGNFREDLFYRLYVMPIYIPPLRRRIEDIVPLAIYFLKEHKFESEKNYYLSEGALQILQNWTWPGNVRELENVIQRAIVMSKSGCIEACDLMLEKYMNCSLLSSYRDEEEIENSLKKRIELGRMWAEYIILCDVMETKKWDRNQLAEALGMTSRALRYRLSKMKAKGFYVPKGGNYGI